jgi:hypothetical protein
MSAKPTEDPVLEAIANAPIGEPETEEERRAVEQARADISAGRTYSGEEVTAMLDQWRRTGRRPSREEFEAMVQERRRAERG